MRRPLLHSGRLTSPAVQRFRFTTSLLFSVAITLEYATPFFPRHFLLLASTANVGKSVGLATYLACTPAFQKSFARGENLADLNAKGQVRSLQQCDRELGRLGLRHVRLHACLPEVICSRGGSR